MPETYIATDREGNAIYGVGSTVEEAIADAREQARDSSATFFALRATQRLCDAVEEHGGAPGDVCWIVSESVGEKRIHHLENYTDNGACDRLVADLEAVE